MKFSPIAAAPIVYLAVCTVILLGSRPAGFVPTVLPSMGDDLIYLDYWHRTPPGELAMWALSPTLGFWTADFEFIAFGMIVLAAVGGLMVRIMRNEGVSERAAVLATLILLAGNRFMFLVLLWVIPWHDFRYWVSNPMGNWITRFYEPGLGLIGLLMIMVVLNRKEDAP